MGQNLEYHNSFKGPNLASPIFFKGHAVPENNSFKGHTLSQYGFFKGQALSFDFLIACTLFFFMAGILLTKVGHEIKDAEEVSGKNALLRDADALSGIFFQEGLPKNWTNETVQVIGLRDGGRISMRKIQEFNKTTYSRSIELLGINNYYYINISSSSGEICSFGYPYTQAKSLVKRERIGVLENGTIVTIGVYIFEK